MFTINAVLSDLVRENRKHKHAANVESPMRRRAVLYLRLIVLIN